MRLNGYKALDTCCRDYALAEELVRVDGGFNHILKTAGESSTSAQTMAHLIGTFYEVMKHEDFVSWDDPRIDQNLITQVS